MRSVVFRPSPRCGRCQLPERWCVCPAHEDIRTPLRVDLLVTLREQFRPSSTGNLIARVLPESRLHVWHRHALPRPADVIAADRDVWILHPNGQSVPAGADPAKVQAILVDGSWNEASAIARAVAPWGRPVSLPMTGESRYWLRAQQDGGRFSTVEALLFLLKAFGLDDAHEALRMQFELHVYAGLRSRGRLERAAEFLASSVLPARCPELLAALHTRRPRVTPNATPPVTDAAEPA